MARAPLIAYLGNIKNMADGRSSMTFLVTIAVAAVAVVLIMGLLNMMRGGSPNTSQTLMRWRVGLQFIAIIVIVIAIYIKSSGGG